MTRDEAPPDSRLCLVILYLCAYLALCLFYAAHIHPNWAAAGFGLAPDALKIAASLFVLALFALAVPVEPGVRTYFLNLMLTIQLLPSLVLYGLADMPSAAAATVWAALGLVIAASAIPLPRLRIVRLAPKMLMTGLALGTTALMAALLVLGEFETFNLDIRAVYEFREPAAEALPSVFAYLAPTFSKTVIPFGLVLALFYRRFVLAAAFLGAALLLFGFTSHKAILLYALVSVGVFLVLSWSGRYGPILVAFLLALALGFADALLAAVTDPESPWGWYASLMIRRALMLPALIDYHYIAFFSENPWSMWSSSRLSFGLVPDPYGLPPARVIGEAYFESADTSANTGLVGSGFAQAGVWGMAAYALGAGLVVAVLDAYGRYLGLAVVAAAMTSQVMTMLVSTDFVTLFLTHGMLASLALLAVTARPRPEASSAGPVPADTTLARS